MAVSPAESASLTSVARRLVAPLCFLGVVACVGKREKPPTTDSMAQDNARPAVALHGTWIRIRPATGDTLVIHPDGRASGPPAMDRLGPTTRWKVDDQIDRSAICLGDATSMLCMGVRVEGDTLRLGDRLDSKYVRAPSSRTTAMSIRA